MILVNEPDPVPLLVVSLAIVGFGFIAQQTPFDTIADPPSDVILPPDFALVEVLSVTETVLRVASSFFFKHEQITVIDIRHTAVCNNLKDIFIIVKVG